jgi:hypothetical protein
LQLRAHARALCHRAADRFLANGPTEVGGLRLSFTRDE